MLASECMSRRRNSRKIAALGRPVVCKAATGCNNSTWEARSPRNSDSEEFALKITPIASFGDVATKMRNLQKFQTILRSSLEIDTNTSEILTNPQPSVTYDLAFSPAALQGASAFIITLDTRIARI